MSSPTTDPVDLLWQEIAAAQREWDYQRDLDVESLPDCPFKKMTPASRDAYLQSRLLHRLYTIMQIAGTLPGHEWVMSHGD
jgi:hypothetical protein